MIAVFDDFEYYLKATAGEIAMVKRAFIVGVLLILGACQSRPYVAMTQPTFQEKMESARQWQMLASQTVDRMLADLAHAPAPGPYQYGVDGRPLTALASPIYVEPEHGVFARSFRWMIMQELANRGHTVALTPANAIVVQTDTQVVAHAPDQPFVPWASLAGAGGFLGWRASSGWSTGTDFGVGIPLAVGIDAVRYLTDTPDGEIVVTTSIADHGIQVSRDTAIYYVELGDADLYVTMNNQQFQAARQDWDRTQNVRTRLGDPAVPLPYAFSN